MKIKIIAAVLMLVPVFAHGAGESGALFLLSDPGARAASLAGAMSAKTESSAGMFYNPAAAGGVSKIESFLTYNGSIAGINSGHISAVFPAAGVGVAGVSGGYMTAGDIDNALEGEPAVKTGDAYAALSYANRLGAVSFGLALKIFSSGMGDESASAFCADMGVIYEINKSFSIGAAVRNAGPDFKYQASSAALPMTAALGINFKILDIKDHKLSVSADGSYLIPDSAVKAAAGIEYVYNTMLSARAGYAYEQGAITGLTAGAGINLNAGAAGITIDYAFIPALWQGGAFEAVNIVTLGIKY